MIIDIVLGIILGASDIIVVGIIIKIVFGFIKEIVWDIVPCSCYRNCWRYFSWNFSQYYSSIEFGIIIDNMVGIII